MQRRYQLIRRLAAGGMGEVFVARLGGLGDFEKTVAVKLLQPHLVDSPELVARFYAEARLSARMQHPNIVEVFDVGEADGRPFLAMQFVDGVSVSTALRRLHHLGKRMPLPLVRLIAVGLCEALSYAHSLTDARGAPLGVVHRDVTPSNIMLSKAGAVLLTDFGIARVQGGALTEPGVVRGKVAYLAPEQVLHNAPVDARADEYSAALTLFELLCGANPLRAGSSEETLSMVIRGAMPPIAKLRPDVTKGMAAAVKRALSATPAERFPTMSAFRGAFVDGPVATGPDLAEWVQQNFSTELAALRTAEPSETCSLVVADTAPRPSQSPFLFALGLLVLVAVAGASLAKYSLAQPKTPPQTIAAPPRQEPRAAATQPETAFEQQSKGAPAGEPGADRPPQGPPLPREVSRQTAPPARVAPQPQPQLQPLPQPQPQPQTPRVGYLTADAVPWAQVEEAGTVIDRTPFSRLPLPIGSHTLLFRGPNGNSQVRTVVITENEVTPIRVEFQ